MIYPVDADSTKVSLNFGDRYPKEHALAGKPHLGVDIVPKVAGESIVVYSPCDGTVIRAGYAPNFGYHVRIKDSRGYIHILAHLFATPLLRQGNVILAGRQVGWIGSHLHYEVRTSDQLPPPQGCRISPLKELKNV